jgi:hypothetical protein
MEVRRTTEKTMVWFLPVCHAQCEHLCCHELGLVMRLMLKKLRQEAEEGW